MHGVVVLDRHGEPLGPLVTWQDQRCLADGFLSELRQQTGSLLHAGYGCATLAWLYAHAAMSADAVAAATIHDLAVMRLTGAAMPLTDPTDAASWGLFDLMHNVWDVDAVRATGIPVSLLPEVRPCGSRAGVLGTEFATVLGLPAGIPVAVAIGDNQASLLAVLRDPERELALTLGTGGQASAIFPMAAKLPALSADGPCEYRPFPGGRIALVAASLCGGASWAWLIVTFTAWLKACDLPLPSRDELYERFNTLGLAAADTLTVDPRFFGERGTPAVRGAITGIDATNGTPGALARGLARGICTVLHDLLPPAALVGRVRLCGSGNALRRNRLLQQMAAEVFALPLVLNADQDRSRHRRRTECRNVIMTFFAHCTPPSLNSPS